MHLLRHLAPHILANAERFDKVIDQLRDACYDLRFDPLAPVSIQDIPSNLPSLSAQHMACRARVQLRSLAIDGGVDLPAMRDIAIPAFYAAHIRHLRQLLQEGTSGPYLLDADSSNQSTGLFSGAFYQAESALIL